VFVGVVFCFFFFWFVFFVFGLFVFFVFFFFFVFCFCSSYLLLITLVMNKLALVGRYVSKSSYRMYSTTVPGIQKVGVIGMGLMGHGIAQVTYGLCFVVR